MSFVLRTKLHQKVAAAVFIFFMGVMIAATIIAYGRTSGVTSLDMTKIQKLRYLHQETLKSKKP